jgi:hypothetical protein
MIYTKAPNQNHKIDPIKAWGEFTRYIEIGDDSYPVRHVDVFANGYSLRYDRSHWVDELGVLAQMRYDRKKWEEWWEPSEGVSPQEFEAVWRAAESSPVRLMQLDGELMSRYGDVPAWLGRTNAEVPGP